MTGSTFLLAGVALLLPAAALADMVGLVKQDKVEGACGEKGGVFWPKTGPDSTYGCMNPDGHGIVCGGWNATYKKSCDTFLTANGRRLGARQVTLAAHAPARNPR